MCVCVCLYIATWMGGWMDRCMDGTRAELCVCVCVYTHTQFFSSPIHASIHPLIHVATAPSGPWSLSRGSCIHLSPLLVSSILAFLGVTMHPSGRRADIYSYYLLIH